MTKIMGTKSKEKDDKTNSKLTLVSDTDGNLPIAIANPQESKSYLTVN